MKFREVVIAVFVARAFWELGQLAFDILWHIIKRTYQAIKNRRPE